VDPDWWQYRHALEQISISIEFLCPDAMP